MRDLSQIEVMTQKGTACGTTSLAMVVRFLTHDANLTPDDIDREIRRLPGMFSAPPDLLAFARRKHLRAVECNDTSLQQLEDVVNRGIPAMALLDLTPDKALDFSQWHWVVVVGVRGPQSQKTVVVNNPWGRREEWEQGRFLKEWGHLRMLGLVFGYSNYLIAVGTSDDALPNPRVKGLAAANAVTKGLADVLNGFARVRSNGTILGLGQMLWGSFVLLYGAVRLIGHNIGLMFKMVTKGSGGEGAGAS